MNNKTICITIGTVKNYCNASGSKILCHQKS
jgi:hypothetical protein